jgi:hypothetical protein
MPIDRPSAAGLPPASSRSAATNRPASRFNANTATGRRCRDLFRGYLSQLGSPADAPTQALVLSAAEAIVLAEIARKDCLAGMNGMNAELMIRLENTANRALRRLGLAKAAPPPPRKSIVERLAEAEARAADAEPTA